MLSFHRESLQHHSPTWRGPVGMPEGLPRDPGHCESPQGPHVIVKGLAQGECRGLWRSCTHWTLGMGPLTESLIEEAPSSALASGPTA